MMQKVVELFVRVVAYVKEIINDEIVSINNFYDQFGGGYIIR